MNTEHEALLERSAPHETLAAGREQIDIIDERLAQLYALRLRTAYELKLARRLINAPVYNSEQQNVTRQAFVDRTEDGPVSHELALDIIRPLMTSELTLKVDPRDIEIHAGREAEAPGVIDSCVDYMLELDAEIADLLTARLLCAIDIGAAKRDLGLPVYRGDREAEVTDQFVNLCIAGNVPERLARDTILRIVRASRDVQEVVVANDETHIEVELRGLDATLPLEAAR